MERLVDRFLKDEILVPQPLRPNQHAYQAGKSVETALHQLVVRAEKTLDQQEIAIGVFLDIEGAFDNTSYDSMCPAFTRQGVDQTIIRWIRATLEGRYKSLHFTHIKAKGIFDPTFHCKWYCTCNESQNKHSFNQKLLKIHSLESKFCFTTTQSYGGRQFWIYPISNL